MTKWRVITERELNWIVKISESLEPHLLSPATTPNVSPLDKLGFWGKHQNKVYTKKFHKSPDATNKRELI